MFLGYFTENAYENLLHNIERNESKYNSEEDWLDKYFGPNKEYFKISKNVDVAHFKPFYTPGEKNDSQKNEEDLINTRSIYDAFRNLTPLQASNKYMWTYLCHAIPEYREYIKDRWMQSARSNTIRTRFFVTGSNSLWNDNALSRLWWYGHLTYDDSNSDHYALTKILLMNQTICTDVIDTPNKMNFNRIKGVLLAIKDFSETLNGNEGITDYFRECKKYLNHYAAVTTLEFLDYEEIRDLTFNYMVKLRNSKLNNN